MACHHHHWRANTVERRQAWHAIITFGLVDTVRRHRAWHPIIALEGETRSNDVERGMPSTPKDSTQGSTTSGVACYHLLWVAHMVRLRRVWHAITSFGQHTWSDDVGRGMPSSSLGSTNGRTTPMWHANITFGQHTRSNDVRRGIPASPLGSTHGRKTSSVA